MPATFGKFLIFQMTAGQSRTFEFVNGPPDILGAAEPGIGINDRGDLDRACNEAGQRGDFIQREQSNIWQTSGAIRQSRAADVNGFEPGAPRLAAPWKRSARRASRRCLE